MPRIRLARHAAYSDQQEALRLASIEGFRKGMRQGNIEGRASLMSVVNNKQRELTKAIGEREAAQKSYAAACQQLEKLEEELNNSREMAQALMHQSGPNFTISVHSPIGKATIQGLNLDHEIKLFQKKTEAAQRILTMDMAAVETRVAAAGRRMRTGDQRTPASDIAARWRFANLYGMSFERFSDLYIRNPGMVSFTSTLPDPDAATPIRHRGRTIFESIRDRHQAGGYSFGGTVTGRISSRDVNPSNTPQAIVDTEVADAIMAPATEGNTTFVGFHGRSVAEHAEHVAAPDPESTREELIQHAIRHQGAARPRDPFVGQFYCGQDGQVACMTPAGWDYAGRAIDGSLYPHHEFQWPGTAHYRPDGHPRGVEEEEEHDIEADTPTGTSVMGVDFEIGDRIETSDGRVYIYRGQGIFDPAEPPRGLIHLDSLSALRRSGVIGNEHRETPQEEATRIAGIDRAEAGQDWTAVVNLDRSTIARVFRGSHVYATEVVLGSSNEPERNDSQEDDNEEDDDEEEAESTTQPGLTRDVMHRADEALRNVGESFRLSAEQFGRFAQALARRPGDPDFDEDDEEEDPADDENYRLGP